MSSKERVRVRTARPDVATPKNQELDFVQELPMWSPSMAAFASQSSSPEDEATADDSGRKSAKSPSNLPPPQLDVNNPADLIAAQEFLGFDPSELGFGKPSPFSFISGEPSQKSGTGKEEKDKKRENNRSAIRSLAAPPFHFADGVAQFKLIPKDLPPGEFDEKPSVKSQVEEPKLENNDFEAEPAPDAPSQTPAEVGEKLQNQADQEINAAKPEEFEAASAQTAGNAPDPNRKDSTAQEPKTPEPPKARPKLSNGIPDSVRGQMEAVFGINVASVKIVQNSTAAKEAGALAFAAGNEIHFAPGQFSPNTPQGQQLLGHEMAHLVQQREGRVAASGEMNGMAINNDASLEAEADAMALKAMKAGDAPGQEQGLTVANALSSAAPVAQLQDDGSDLYSGYQDLLAWATEQKTKITSDTTTLKDQVTKAGDDQKKTITDLIEQQVTRMKEAIKTAQEHLRTTTSTARTTLTTHRDTKVKEVNDVADKEIADITKIVQDKKQALIDKGETHATGLISHAETEATRAVTESNANSTQINTVITTTAANYGDRDGIDQAVTEAQNNSSGLRTEFTELGNTMACEVREDANGMATDIRQEALDAGSEFDQPLTDATDSINKRRNETTEALNGSGENFLTTLEKESEESITALEQQIPTQEATLRSFGEGTGDTVDKSVRDSHALIDEQMQKAATDIDEFVAQLQEIGWHKAEMEAAKTDLEAALTAHRADIDAKTAEVNTNYAQHKAEVQTESDTLTQGIEKIVNDTTTAFDNEVNPKVEGLKGEMDTMATDATDEIKTVKPALEPELEKAVCDTEDKWVENVESSRSDISTKVDAGLEKQRDTLSDFSSQINDEFSSLPSKDRGFWESLWEGIKDIGAFIGGVFVGMFEGLVDMLKGIIDIILTPAKWLLAAVVIIAAVIVIAIVAAVAGISFGLAALIVGAVIGLGFMAYYFYKAATAEGLSPYERGKLVGRGLFEGIMAFAGTGVLGRLAGWSGRIGKLAAIVSKVGGLRNFLKIAVYVDDIERLINIINKTDDIGRLASLFGKLDNAKDAAKLLDLIDHIGDAGKIANLLGDGANIGKLLNFIDDAGKLTAVLERVGDVSVLSRLIAGGKLKNLTQLETMLGKMDDVARLESMLGKVQDAAQLERLLVAVGDDAARLEALLGKMDDAAQLERLLPMMGGDAAKLESLLGKVDDAAQLEKLLGAVGNDVTRLESLLGKVENAAQLDNLLAAVGNDATRLEALLEKVDNATQLQTLLTAVGNDAGRLEAMLSKVENAAQLETLLAGLGNDAARLEGILTKVDDGAQLTRLLDQVGGDAAKLESLLTRTGSGAAAETFLQQLKSMEDKLTASGLTRVDDGSGVVRFIDSTGKEIATLDNFVMKYSYGGHGGQIIMDPDRTTTIIGKFQDPTTPGWGTEWVHNMPDGSFSRQGNNPGGLNMLDVDPVTWDKLLVEAGGDEALRNQIFWERYNLPFLEESFKNGDNIRLLSDPNNPLTRTGTYARELDAIEGAGGFAEKYGYIFDAASQSYKPGPNFQLLRNNRTMIDQIASKVAGGGSKFTKLYSDVEVAQLIEKGKALGLDNDTITDLIFIGQRADKPIVASELMNQMDNFVNEVMKLGKPYRFKSPEEFVEFQSFLKGKIGGAGISTGDIRIQGSALRKPTANDVDIAVFISESEFNGFLISRYSGKITEGGKAVNLTGMDHAALTALAQKIQASGSAFNAHARTFANAMLNRTISSKSDIIKALKDARKAVSEAYPDLNIEAITLMTPGGAFDLKPYIRVP